MPRGGWEAQGCLARGLVARVCPRARGGRPITLPFFVRCGRGPWFRCCTRPCCGCTEMYFVLSCVAVAVSPHDLLCYGCSHTVWVWGPPILRSSLSFPLPLSSCPAPPHSPAGVSLPPFMPAPRSMLFVVSAVACAVLPHGLAGLTARCSEDELTCWAESCPHFGVRGVALAWSASDCLRGAAEHLAL
jgi:hypothetical protein